MSSAEITPEITIATWNVNSIKARLEHLVRWLDSFKPDVVALQELKTTEEGFPGLEIQAAGYHWAMAGQKSYNGVALLSKEPIDLLEQSLPGDKTDEQARYIEGRTLGLRVGAIYLPNGNPADSEKFPYKLGWMERLERHAKTLLTSEEPILLCGDYNVIPEPEDCYDPVAWASDALFRPESRAALRRLIYLGYTDAFRAFHTEPHRYSFWDYQGGAWQNDLGIRIDHLLLSPQAADRLRDSGIDREPRGWKKASDHTPVWCRLAAQPPDA